MTTLADYPQLIVIVVLVPMLLGFWLVRRNVDASGTEAGEFTARVGARVGWTRASWPLASLTVSKTGLRLSALGTYVFTPSEVVGLERVGIPFVLSGVRIVHSRADYPENIVVWYLGSADRLIARIGEAGFHGTAPVTSAAGAKGLPLLSTIPWEVQPTRSSRLKGDPTAATTGLLAGHSANRHMVRWARYTFGVNEHLGFVASPIQPNSIQLRGAPPHARPTASRSPPSAQRRG